LTPKHPSRKSTTKPEIEILPHNEEDGEVSFNIGCENQNFRDIFESQPSEQLLEDPPQNQDAKKSFKHNTDLFAVKRS
jgi:hypothetical protein